MISNAKLLQALFPTLGVYSIWICHHRKRVAFLAKQNNEHAKLILSSYDTFSKSDDPFTAIHLFNAINVYCHHFDLPSPDRDPECSVAKLPELIKCMSAPIENKSTNC